MHGTRMMKNIKCSKGIFGGCVVNMGSDHNSKQILQNGKKYSIIIMKPSENQKGAYESLVFDDALNPIAEGNTLVCPVIVDYYIFDAEQNMLIFDQDMFDRIRNGDLTIRDYLINEFTGGLEFELV